MKKIIVAHPEKQHSYRLAQAAFNAGILQKYITTVYYKTGNITYLLHLITKGRMCLNKIRKMPDMPDEKIKQFCELGGLTLLSLRRFAPPAIVNFVQNLSFDRFGGKVAAYALNCKVDAVVMYDTNSLKCFRQLKDQKVIRIMDTSIANRAYTKHIYESVVKQPKDWEHFSEKSILLSSSEMKRLTNEIKETDYFLVPSKFVKKSLEFSGVNPEKIYIVPYGVDVNLFRYSKRRKNIEEGPLELLFVGQCSYRKGINYLLEAASQRANMVNLTIVGGYSGIQELYKKYSSYKNIRFTGRLSHDKLPEVYEKADVFVLPSLSEGMSLVGLEAMASGLPLLCSQNCGVNDVVIENQNGWILEEISTKCLIKKFDYINSIRKRIPAMGIMARKTSEQYSWESYERNMKKTLFEILGE